MMEIKEFNGMLDAGEDGRRALTGAVIRDADLKDGLYKGIDFKDCRFSYSDFSGASFEGCTFENCRFLNCHMRLSSFKECGFHGTILGDSELTGSGFYKCRADNSVFSGRGVRAAFEDCEMNDSRLSGDFPYMHTSKCRFGDVRFGGDFTYAGFYNSAGDVSFRDADMAYAMVMHSDFSAAPGGFLCGKGYGRINLTESRLTLGIGDKPEELPLMDDMSAVEKFHDEDAAVRDGLKSLAGSLSSVEADREAALKNARVGRFYGDAGAVGVKSAADVRSLLAFMSDEHYAGTGWCEAAVTSDLSRFQERLDEIRAFAKKGRHEAALVKAAAENLNKGARSLSAMYEDAREQSLDGFADAVLGDFLHKEEKGPRRVREAAQGEVKWQNEVSRAMAEAESLSYEGLDADEDYDLPF